MDINEAYLVGYTKGDGCLYSIKRTFSLDPSKKLRMYEICWGDKDIQQLEIISEILRNKFPQIKTKIRTRKTNKGKTLKCTRKLVYQHIELLLKQDITKMSKEIISSFISGFCDAEADVGLTKNAIYKNKTYKVPRIQITQKDKGILSKIKELLIKYFSIKSTIYKKWNQDVYVLQIKAKKQVLPFQKYINFRNPTKRLKLHNILFSGV